MVVVSVRRFFSNLIIDKGFHFGEIEWYFLVLFIMREQPHCGHYTSRVKVNNTWFLIADTRILRHRNYNVTQSISVFLTYLFIKG